MAYKRYTEEQIERANRISVVDYARSQGLEIERGSGTWRKAKHQGGLIFNTSKNTWKWETEDKYGRGAISLCMELENKTFQEAVETLIGEGMEEIRNLREWKKPEQPVAKDFNLPPRNDTNKHVYAYLTKTRGIDAGIVKNMLDAGYIYENDKKSCVFVGFDKEHTARHASIRSTNTQGKAFKQDVTGSQKQFSFSVDGTSGIVNVTEAPIDALSVMSIQKMRGTGKGDAYVALGGVSDRALERYLEDHPEITGIRICTDNDEAGEKAAERIREKYGEKYKIGCQVSQRKDFNEDLIAMHKDREFRQRLHDVVSGKSNISDSIVIGKTPNILVACGANENMNFTISKDVIDKSMRAEIRDAEGRLIGKTGHGLTEQQLCDALLSVKTPIMILKGNRDNSLIAVTEQTDNQNRPVFVTFTLDKMSGRTEINNVTSVYGRDKFQEYLERQVENENILAVDNKKAEQLLQPIGKWYPKRGEVISYDATIAYSMESVKYPETNSDEREAAAESGHEGKETPVLNEQEEDGMASVSKDLQETIVNERKEVNESKADELLKTPDQSKDLTINEDVVSVSEIQDRAKESGEDYDSELLDMWAQEYMDTYADPIDVIGYDDERAEKEVKEIDEEKEIEEKPFSQQVDEVLAGKFPFYSALKVCDTPNILLEVGCEQLPILYTQKHLKNAVKPIDNKEHQHGLTVNQIKALPDLLEDPVMIMDSLSRKDSIVVVTSESDPNGNPVLVSIRPNGKGRYELEEMESNFITSIYGRNRFYNFVENVMKQDKLLYCDKTKSQILFERWGEQYSELTNNFDFNKILHQSNNIVKENKVLAQGGVKVQEKKYHEPDVSVEEEKINLEPPETVTEETSTIKQENLVKLQGIPYYQKGTPAKDLKIGDVIIWNGGVTSEIVGLEPSKTGKTILFQMKNTEDGVVRERRMKVGTLAVVQEKEVIININENDGSSIHPEEATEQTEPDISISNFEANESGQIDFDVNIEDEIHKGQADFEDDGNVNWVFVDPVPVNEKSLSEYIKANWDRVVQKVTEILQNLRYKSKELMRALGRYTNSRADAQNVQPKTAAQTENSNQGQQNSEQNVSQDNDSVGQDKAGRTVPESGRNVSEPTVTADNEDAVSVSETQDREKESGEDYESELLDMWAQEYMDNNADMIDGIGYDDMQADWEGEEQGERILESDAAEVSPDASMGAEELEDDNIVNKNKEIADKKKEEAFGNITIENINGGIQNEAVVGGTRDERERLGDALQVSRENYVAETSGNIISLRNDMMESFVGFINEYTIDDKIKEDALRVAVDPAVEGDVLRTYVDSVVNAIGAEDSEYLTDKLMDAVTVLRSKIDRLERAVELTWNRDYSIRLQGRSDFAVSPVPQLEIAQEAATAGMTVEELAIEIQKHLYDYDNNFSESAAVISENLTNGNIDEYLEQLDRYAEDLNSDAAEMSLYASVGAEEVADADKAIEKYNTVMDAMGRLQEFQKRVTPLQPAQKASGDITLTNANQKVEEQVIKLQEEKVATEELAKVGTQTEQPEDNFPSPDPTAEPTVTIIWSEHSRLHDGETMSLSEANSVIGNLDEAITKEDGYYKTKFRIDFVMDGKHDYYVGRQDLGDGDGTLIDHIEKYHAYYENNEQWDDYLLRNGGAEALEADKAQRDMLLNEFVPYLKLHNNLSKMEQTATIVLQLDNEALTSIETAYYTAMQEYVSKCRAMANQGNLDNLPLLPQLENFKEEIAQEAAGAGMTVEELAIEIQKHLHDYDKNFSESADVISENLTNGNIDEYLEQLDRYAEDLNSDAAEMSLYASVGAEEVADADKAIEKYNTVMDAMGRLREFQKRVIPLQPDQKVYEDYLQMVSGNGNSLKNVPQEFYTEELLLAAVSNWGAAMKYIPEEVMTNDIAMAGVKQYGTNLKHVPDKLRTQEVCVAAYVSSGGSSFKYTPAALKENVKKQALELLGRDSVNYPDAKHQLDADNLQNQGAEWMSRIETMLREHETDAEAMAEDIAFAGKFYKYSARNIQLMLQQNRGITYVGSATHFKQLGYQVKQDEKAMIARVPVQSRYIVNDDNKRVYSSDYTQEIKDAIKNGTLKENVTSKRFKYVSAFYDISQTDCPPEDYPSIYHMGFPSEMHQNLFDAMKEFAVSQGFRVQVVDMKSIALRGAANPDEKIIRINDKLEPTMALSTLCHEIGHGLLHTSGKADKMTQAQKECEADVVSIMIMANLGLPISDIRKEHLLKAFTEYKEQQASKKRPYEVTLEKLIDRVQTKVFRPYVEEMNRCISRHLPSEGIQNEMQAEEVIGSIANLDAAHGTDHTDLIGTEKEIFENDRADIYREAYHKAFEETRLYNSFEPKLAILRQQGQVMENGMPETYLCEVKLINKGLAEIFRDTPEMIALEYLGMDIHKGDILVFRENLMAAPAVYQAGVDKLVPVTEESLPGLLNAITSDSMLNKINSGFDIRHEYECLHSLLQREVPLEPEMINLYEKLCDTFAFEKLQTRDNSLQFQARLNLITDELSEPDKELVAEYVFRTGNFKKAEKYAEKLAANPETSGQILTEMGIVDSYKYMLWTIAEYENNMDLPESQRITTGAYNSASIPVLSSNVKSLSQINNSFISIRQCAAPDRVKYYAIKEAEGEFKIAYVALDGYRPELRYSVPFNSYEAALDFYNSFISDTNSNLAGENENLIELERKNNEIILSEVTAIAATLIDGKEELKESYPELSEEELLDALRRELAVKHREVSDKIPDNVKKELELLKEFKQGITDKEHFVEICNLQKLSVNKEENSDFNYQEALNEFSDTLQWVVDIGDEVGRLSFPQVNEVWDCIEAALDGEVTVSHINNAFNAIDARILSVEFEGMESEYAEYADYAGVFETLKQAYVMPDKYCYVDFSDQDEPYLYTSDPAGNMYKKSVHNYAKLESVGNLYNELQVRGYQVCTDFNEFKALSANKRIAGPDAEKDKNGAYVKILSHTEGWDIASAHELCSVFEFKQQMDKQQAGTGGNPGSITYELVVKSDKEVQSYIENYSGNTGRNVYEQLYDKVKEDNPELNRVIAKQYYQDQIDFNEKHYIKPVISQMKKQEIRLLQEKQPVSDYTAYKDERGDIHVDYGNTEMNSGKLDGMEVFLKGKTAAGEELMQLSRNLQILSDSMDANEKLQEEIQKLDLSPADADILKLNGGMITPEQLRMQVNQQKQQQIKKSELKTEMEFM